ncbi:MAG: hypothetical protein KKE02_01220 [Alphaproteobacteria bacterium]|nr:hypothetical protein [Alphaproteobacteria bacterium]MBU1515620.1 hypothetical protein [Alphaproteobacteria bacterium]MBU2096955.1 hypothetical protein [Alphaproteobacteria bacterium]MBU2149610.1 hypothetical protein [Alphaproteobacteria bacterium]MBU2305654.1 hypothetical protein [Alphaproteobacteria bacterium]
MRPGSAARHTAPAVLAIATSLILTACSKPAADAKDSASAGAGTPAAVGVVADPPGKPDQVRTIPVSVQGVAPIGVTVRVKSVELGTDATILDVSASYAGNATAYVDLATTDTFLLTPAGERLMLKRPDDNRDLRVRDGDTMDGKLVFLGRTPPDAASVTLVFNKGNKGDDTIGPGLEMTIPLQPSPAG